MNTILVGYDDTDESKRALERAIEIAKAFQAKLLVTSVAPVMVNASGRSMGAIDPTDTPADREVDLQHAADTIKAAGLSAELLPAIGHPAETIVSVAGENNVDLIVVGSRELDFLHRMLGQSISKAVATRANCDVLIVH